VAEKALRETIAQVGSGGVPFISQLTTVPSHNIDGETPTSICNRSKKLGMAPLSSPVNSRGLGLRRARQSFCLGMCSWSMGGR
jgi:hypothetical protein